MFDKKILLYFSTKFACFVITGNKNPLLINPKIPTQCDYLPFL